MDSLIYSEIIQRFMSKIASEKAGDEKERKELSYHTQKITIGEQKIDYKTTLQIQFKMNCQNKKYAIVNGRSVFFQFKVKESFTEEEKKEQYTIFTKLIKQLVTVSSMLSQEMKELFKLYKPECQQGKSTFNLYIKLPEEFQQYWITFQEYLLSFFANISREELVVARMQSNAEVKDIINIMQQAVNPFFPFFQNCKIEISSLLNKLINEESKAILSELNSNDADEKQSNDLLMLLYNLTQSQIEVQLDSFSESELSLLGIAPIQVSQIEVDFQPAIISKIQNFFKKAFTGVMKVNFLNSHTMCQFKLDTKEDISQLFDIFIKVSQ